MILNALSLMAYKRTIWLQIILDILAVTVVGIVLYLMFNYKTKKYEETEVYVLIGIFFCGLFRFLYLIIIFFQILYFKQFKKIFGLLFLAFFVWVQLFVSYLMMMIGWTAGAGDYNINN